MISVYYNYISDGVKLLYSCMQFATNIAIRKEMIAILCTNILSCLQVNLLK